MIFPRKILRFSVSFFLILIFSLLFSGTSFPSPDSDFEKNIPDRWFTAAKEGDVSEIDAMLEKGVPVNMLNSSRRSALCLAVERGHVRVVEKLVTSGAHPMIGCGPDKPIGQALEYGQSKAARILYHRLNRPHWKTFSDSLEGKLMVASFAGLLEPVRTWIETHDHDARKSVINKACSFAAAGGQNHVIKFLLKHGAKIDSKVVDVRPPLILAIDGFKNYEANHLHTVQLLIKKGADVNVSTGSGKTPLIYAAENGRKNILNMLLKRGADPDHKWNGRNAILIALQNEHFELLLPLIEAGARVNVSEGSGKTSLMYCAEAGEAKKIKQILSAGGNVHAKDEDGKTALMYCAKSGGPDVLNLLLNHGADPDEMDQNNLTALYYALSRENKKMVERLLSFLPSPPEARSKELMTWAAAGDKFDGNKIGKQLIKNEYGVNQKNERGFTPLMYACLYRNPNTVQFLLNHGARVSVKNERGRTALSFTGEPAIIQKLLDAGATPGIQKYEKRNTTPLIERAKGGHVELIHRLIDGGADVHASNEQGQTALMQAAKEGHIDVVQALLEEDARVSDQDDEGRTALMFASKEGHVKVARQLIQAGARPEVSNRYGLTPLMYASYEGNKDVMKLLFKNGGRVNAKATENPEENKLPRIINVIAIEGTTPLMFASVAGRPEAVDLLLKHGADLEITDRYGQTAFSRMIDSLASGNYDREEYKPFDVVDQLMNAECDINATDREGETALMNVASGHSNHEAEERLNRLLQRLIENGVSINARDSSGETALMKAADGGNLFGLQQLIHAGADVNVKDEQGDTPLLHAVRNLQEYIVKKLIDAGAKVNIQNKEKETPLLMASRKGLFATCNLLLSEGAEVRKRDTDGNRPLHIVAGNSPMLIPVLMESGANPFVRNDDNRTPLNIARQRDRDHAVLLLKRYQEEKISEFVARTFKRRENRAERRITSLIDKLGDGDYSTRQKAMKKLISIGEQAMYYLKQNRNHGNPEVKSRIKKIIRRIARRKMQNAPPGATAD